MLTGISSAGVAGNFGVPAAYFYALAATLPVQVTATQHYQTATGSQLSRLLTDLTSAINAGTTTDSEAFVTLPTVTPPTANTTTAAQAARRLRHGRAPGHGHANRARWAPCRSPSRGRRDGHQPPGRRNRHREPGHAGVGANIAPGTAVASVGSTDLVLTQPVLDRVPAGTTVFLVPLIRPTFRAWSRTGSPFRPTFPGRPAARPTNPARRGIFLAAPAQQLIPRRFSASSCRR